jgi:hypothetical protein
MILFPGVLEDRHHVDVKFHVLAPVRRTQGSKHYLDDTEPVLWLIRSESILAFIHLKVR